MPNVEAKLKNDAVERDRAVIRPREELAPHAARRRLAIIPILITAAVFLLAVASGWGMWRVYMEAPWTRDGTVRAYVVTMAPEVVGRIVELPVADNQFVHKGDLLMVIDPTDYRIAVKLAEAAVQQAQVDADNLERESRRRQELSNAAVTVEVQQTFAANAIAGKAKDIKCSFAPGSVLVGGGGMKGYKDAPPDWEKQVKEFFGIEKMASMYGMSEIMGNGPLCPEGYFHLPPYTIPVLVDAESRALPQTGVQQGRMAVFDLLADTYWGGSISGDKVTVHWEDDCQCGWAGPRVAKTIERYAEAEGGDDKITCAGSAQAYSEFMDYVTSI